MRILPIALLAALMIAAPAKAATDVTPLAPPAGNVVFDAGVASGVQIYTCNGSAWTFSGPRATLRNLLGQPTWTHYAGPTWKHKDGSTVVGQAVANVPVSTEAIPWLLLKAVSTTPGHMARTTYIQRLATTGGLAPAASTCTTAGTVKEVPYTALYVFWKAA